MRRMRRIIKNAIDGRLALIGCLAGDLPTGVAVAVEAGEVAAGAPTLRSAQAPNRAPDAGSGYA